MSKEEILSYLRLLNVELAQKNIKGEICLYGGAVMCLAFDARPNTQDVDAVFKPASEIRAIAATIAKDNDLREDWLNDGVKGFIVEHHQNIFLDESNLKVYIPDVEYMLAMKTLSARVDGTDKKDVMFLIKELNVKTAQEVFSIMEKYYSHHYIRPATKFFIEEIFQQ
jgi:hypothetical protein